MKRFAFLLLAMTLHLGISAQGWPNNYEGVMLQGFYWDSYSETSWAKLEAQADEIAPFFKLIWVPQSGWCNNDYTMGYMPVYYFKQKSAFGSESQLRSMIATYRKKGTGFIADVVLNHRKNIGADGSWLDFPAETYNGVTYQMVPTDICGNDDGGTTANWASQNGLGLSINDDTGDDWSGCRDLDHKNPHVQECIKAYLQFLLEDIGYAGFRYDMVKGFWASFVGDYNMAVKPNFSVGEYFDGSTKIKEWINYTKGYSAQYPTSAAFDFQFRYRVRDAISSHNWRNLGWDEKPLIAEDYYKQYAVTFVENHDTEKRVTGESQDPIWRDTLAANAYLLAMPGTPCVFYTHWRDNKYAIKQMILARRTAGIMNTSGCEEKWTDDNYYAKVSYGKYASLLCVVGNKPEWYNASGDYREILSGKGYRYLLHRSANTVWIDVPGGTYEKPLKVKMTTVSNLSGAKIVYTLDGTTPTAESPTIASGGTLSLESSCTLRAGILSGGKVYGLQKRKYEVFVPHDITVYVSSDIAWSGMYFYAWDNAEKKMSGEWPGKRATKYETINGKRWFYQTYRLTSPDQYLNLVVSTTSGDKQTMNIIGIRSDRYICITGEKDEDKYIVEDQTEDVETGINSPYSDQDDKLPLKDAKGEAYDLSGRKIADSKQSNLKGIVIKNGKKIAY
ncbi:MAG: chitobiase/beta-hexosaminidase C-terminal domain-containing protein [Bacteroidaceae bacterium]|nr:chitobiase/beta-hexosaminidase C-terminal domain-containing protein [Bacteroidaceae bacterium]